VGSIEGGGKRERVQGEGDIVGAREVTGGRGLPGVSSQASMGGGLEAASCHRRSWMPDDNILYRLISWLLTRGGFDFRRAPF
jgi:hypothetical protein